MIGQQLNLQSIDRDQCRGGHGSKQMGIRELKFSFSKKEHLFEIVTPDDPSGAVFVSTQERLEVGEPLVIKLYFTDITEGVCLRGHIIWRRLPTKWQTALPAGIGVQLLDGEKRRLQFVVNYCKGRLAPKRVQGERYPTNLPIDCVSNEQRFLGRMQNISRGGLFVATPHLLQKAVPIELNFPVEADRNALQLKGQVVWQLNRPPYSGFGVKFHLLSRKARDTASLVVKIHKPPA